MAAAMMTAANLGARLTGWGFVVFTIGSIAWSVVALSTGQQNLLLTNGFLTLVNMVGIWRWLGRKARYDAGGKAAEARSAASASPTLLALSSLEGAAIHGPDGETIGTVVDGMMGSDDACLAYLVISVGGVAGVGEKLYALQSDELTFGEDGIGTSLSRESIERRETVTPTAWPSRAASAPAPASPSTGR